VVTASSGGSSNSSSNSSSSSSNSSSSETFDDTNSNSRYRVWTWGSKVRPVPPDYVYPKKVTLKTIHDLFYEGVPTEQIKPLKFFKGTDLRNKTESQAHGRAKNLVVPDNYSVQTAADRDSLFVTAFNVMTDTLLSVIGGDKRSVHTMFYTSLYEKYFAPVNKKRKLKL
jgi:hypothetical protein